MKNILTIIFFLGALLLSGCSENQIETSETTTLADNAIKILLNNCDEEQRRINMLIIPSCYLSTFKNEGWSKEDAIKYIKEKKDIADIEEKIKSNEFWKKAWEENYG